MDRIIGIIEATSLAAFSAVLTLTEVMVQPLQTGNEQLAEEYRDILDDSCAFTLLPITVPIAESAADLRARYNLRAPPAPDHPQPGRLRHEAAFVAGRQVGRGRQRAAF